MTWAPSQCISMWRRCCPTTSATGCAAGEKPTRRIQWPPSVSASSARRGRGWSWARRSRSRNPSAWHSSRSPLIFSCGLGACSGSQMTCCSSATARSGYGPQSLRPRAGRAGQDFSVGVANASMVCLPLNRRTALAMTMRKGPDEVTDSGPTRARQINMALIHDAQRWIYHHPSDHPLDGIEVPEPAVFTDEVVAVRDGADGTRHEFRRVIRRHPPTPAT